MLKAYEYRLYPTNAQEVILGKFFGVTRWLYNRCLRARIALYRRSKKSISLFSLQKIMTVRMKRFPWLAEVPCQARQWAQRNLDTAYKNFFKGLADFPKFKKKHGRQSFSFSLGGRVSPGQVKIPNLGWVKAITSKSFDGKIKTCTVKKTPTGKYFMSVLVDDGKELPSRKSVTEVISIHRGLRHYVTTSEERRISYPFFLRNAQKTIKHYARALTRKKRGSKRRETARKKLALAHERITNQRKDFLHKLTTGLVRDSQADCFVIETWDIQKMLKTRHLAQSISDAAWFEMHRQIEYKAKWSGKTVIKLDEYFPSTIMCSKCGALEGPKDLSIIEWTCICGARHDRETNAAINVRNYGLKALVSGEPEARLNKASSSDEPLQSGHNDCKCER